MWKLYDDLYIGIPSGIRIAGCIVGEKWTCVSANGNTGIARTLELPGNPAKFQAGFIGAYLRDTGNYMKWDSLAMASVGVAALNAWYNTGERAEGLGFDGEVSDPQGKTAYVGMCEKSDGIVADASRADASRADASRADASCADAPCAGRFFSLPMEADFNEAAYLGLKDFDTVVISADALTTKALPRLMDIIGEEGNIILEGYSLPCTALFFAFDMPVRELRGFYSRFADTLLASAQNAAKDPAPGVLPFTVRR